MHKNSFVLLVLMSFFYSGLYALTVDDFKSQYTAIVKAADSTNEFITIFIPASALFLEGSAKIEKDDNCCDERAWDEIFSSVQETQTLKELDFCIIEPLAIYSQERELSFMLSLDEENLVPCTIELQEGLVFKNIIFVRNDLMQDFSTQTEPEVVSVKKTTFSSESAFDLASLDIEFDEEEIALFTTSNPPSGLLVYAREIGVALYLQSMKALDYAGTQWEALKRFICD